LGTRSRPNSRLEPDAVANRHDSAGAAQPVAVEKGGCARELLRLIFECVWLDDGRIVAVWPENAFAPFFQKRAKTRCKERERQGSIRRFTHRGIEIRL
jgi:hypothetical protein